MLFKIFHLILFYFILFCIMLFDFNSFYVILFNFNLISSHFFSSCYSMILLSIICFMLF